MEAAPRLTAIAAVARNGVIGDGQGLPWHLPGDFARFKRATMGGALVMGRATYDSMGKALPGRTSIVLTRQAAWSPGGVGAAEVLVVHDVEGALAALAARRDQRWWCIGGGQIYAALWPYTTHLDLSEVKASPPGSVRFPVIEAARWRVVRREPGEAFDVVWYERRGPEAAEALREAVTKALGHAG